MKKCLEGLKVLEATQFICGPYAGQTLADFGADVYKIEMPGEGNGDVARQYDPFHNGMSLYFANYNRNKKFLTLDLKCSDGKKIFLDIVRDFDVMLHNFRPGAMERMGLGYEDLKTVNPGIIVAAASGYGQTGPYAQMAALDMSIQAQSGFMDVTGFPDGPPTRAGVAVSDFVGGMNLVIGILLALQYKQRTGEGQFVDVSLFDGMAALHENYASVYYAHGVLPKRTGNGRPFSALAGTYKTKDGRWIQISATINQHFQKLIALAGRPDLIDDPRMGTPGSRKRNEPFLDAVIAEWVANHGTDKLIAALDKEKLPYGLVLSAEELYNDPRMELRQMLVRPDKNVLGDVPVLGNPVKLSKTPANYVRSAVDSGADNDSSYKELLGLTSEQLGALREKGVI